MKRMMIIGWMSENIIKCHHQKPCYRQFPIIYQVYRGGELVNLTPKEYELLEVLITNRNIALSRDKLLELVWEYDFDGDSRTVDVHIQKLRKKLGWENRIKTVYKLGYRLETRK